MVVNKLKNTSGTITLEIPQNSLGNWFLRRWARWQKNSQDPSRMALGTLTIQDAAGEILYRLHWCDAAERPEPGFRPDRAFDRTGTNLTYTLLAATITEQ